MSFGQTLRLLRTERDISQEELGKMIGTNQKAVSGFELGSIYPSTETLIKIAHALDVSLDYLARERVGMPQRVDIRDNKLLRRFETIDKYPPEERQLACQILDLVIKSHDFKKLASK